jgi:putative oxidoreductase
MGFLRKYSEELYALLRMVAGFLFACHGAQKLFGALGGKVSTEPLFLTAGVIEFGGGLLILMGFFAGVAAFLASGEMAVAYFKFHFPAGFWPILNHGEVVVLYCFFFLYVAARGAGKWSVDGLLGRNPKS